MKSAKPASTDATAAAAPTDAKNASAAAQADGKSAAAQADGKSAAAQADGKSAAAPTDAKNASTAGQGDGKSAAGDGKRSGTKGAADDATFEVRDYVIDDSHSCRATRVGTYWELHVRALAPPAAAAAAPNPSGAKGVTGWGLLALVIDWSGSMYGAGLARPMARVLKAVAGDFCANGGEVLFVPWARSAAFYVLTAANYDQIIEQFGADRVSVDRSGRGADASHAWHPDAAVVPFRQFDNDQWHGKTLPRSAFETLQECLAKYLADRGGVGPVSLQVLFATDGEFSDADPKTGRLELLSDAFLRDLKQTVVDFPAPVSMVYLGVIRDHVPDAPRVLSAFPVSHYRFVTNADELDKCAAPDSDVRLKLAETNLLRLFPVRLVKRRGATERHHVAVDERGRAIIHGVDEFEPDMAAARCRRTTVVGPTPASDELKRRPLLQLRLDLAAIEAELVAIQAQYGNRSESGGDEARRRDTILRLETQLTDLSRGLNGLMARRSVARHPVETLSPGEETWTRQRLYAIMRLKNGLQVLAGAEALADPSLRARLLLSANQDLKMNGIAKFSAVVAKQITRNAAKLRTWRVTAQRTEPGKDDRIFLDTIVDFDGGQGEQRRVFRSDVPRSVADEDEGEFMTAESWGDLYGRGDAKCHAFRLPRRPHEGCLHQASILHLRPTNTQVALSSYYAAVDQHVAVHGFEALFDKPFVGVTASEEDKYNVALPTWGPNLEFACKMRLKPLLGLLQAGHELAHTPRSADIYVPAILGLWARAMASGSSSRAVEDALLMTNAFRHVRQWLRLARPAPGADVALAAHRPAPLLRVGDLLGHFMRGETGAHLFPEPLEPLVLALLAVGAETAVAEATTVDDEEAVEKKEKGAGADVCTALVVLPPEAVCGPIQTLRASYDKAYNRWPPHINLLFPFVPRAKLEAAAEQIAAIVRTVPPFEVRLRRFGDFQVGGQQAVWLEPECEPPGALVDLQAKLSGLFPELADKRRRKFVPHLSVGQWPRSAPAPLSRLQESFDPTSFVVQRLHIIARDGDRPFAVRHAISLKSGIIVTPSHNHQSDSQSRPIDSESRSAAAPIGSTTVASVATLDDGKGRTPPGESRVAASVATLDDGKARTPPGESRAAAAVAPDEDGGNPRGKVDWDWASVLRGVQREVIFGCVARQADMQTGFVEPVVSALLADAEIAARLAQDATWAWRPVKEWPDHITVLVHRALASSGRVAEAVERVLDGPTAERLDLAQYLARAGADLPTDTFACLDRDYRLVPSALDRIRTAGRSQAFRPSSADTPAASTTTVMTLGKGCARWGLDVVDAVGWVCFAIECPSNSTRRESAAAIAERPLGPLLTQLKRALDLKLSAEAKDRQIRQRRQAKLVAHGTLPMLFRDRELHTLRRCAQSARSAEAFCAAFRREFADQLVLLQRVFVAGKRVGTDEDWDAAVTVALTNLFAHRADLEQNVPLSCTCLPKRACAHVTCPEFMQRQPNDLSAHLADLGSDLPAKHPERDFVAAWHHHGRNLYHANPDKATWIASMKRYSAAVIPSERLVAYDTMIDVLYSNVQHFY